MNIETLITVITPCYRQENLEVIYKSLNFDYICEWIIVYDTKCRTFEKMFENECSISEYFHTSDGISGNPQRNYGLSKVKNKYGYIYFLDDDNIIHPDFYSIELTPNKMYTFNQEHNGKLRLKGYKIKINNIDTAMLLISYQLITDIFWNVGSYSADGEFIVDCYLRNKRVWKYIDKILCYYNKLNV